MWEQAPSSPLLTLHLNTILALMVPIVETKELIHLVYSLLLSSL